jgi:hypothetical protein
MKIDIPDDGMLDGAMLFDARFPRNREDIAEVLRGGQHVVIIRKKKDHFVVEYRHRVSGKPQWSIDFWSEKSSSSITDTLADAERLADAFTKEAEQQNPELSSAAVASDEA